MQARHQQTLLAAEAEAEAAAAEAVVREADSEREIEARLSSLMASASEKMMARYPWLHPLAIPP